MVSINISFDARAVRRSVQGSPRKNHAALLLYAVSSLPKFKRFMGSFVGDQWRVFAGCAKKPDILKKNMRLGSAQRRVLRVSPTINRSLVSPNPPREQIEVHEPSAALKLACYLSHT